MGAVFLSALGIELMKIQMLARWSSHIITHYTRLAPLRSITNDFKRAVLNAEAKLHIQNTGKSNDKPSKPTRITSTDKKKIIKSLQKDLEKANKEFNELREMINRVASECRPRRCVQTR